MLHIQKDFTMAEETNTDPSVGRRLKLGIVGIGVGASEILPQMETMSDIQLVAAADINRRVLNTFQPVRRKGL